MSFADKIARKTRAAWLTRLSSNQIQTRLERRRGALFLCYHSLSEDLSDYPYRTSPAAFEAQLAFLTEVFDILPAAAAVAALRSSDHRNHPRPIAALCFDDGYRDNLTVATPILESYGIPATLFAPRDLIQREGATYMNEAELCEIARHPLWTVGAHGITHNVLTGFLPGDQRREMTESHDWLADLLGAPPAGFAYPQGAAGDSVIAMAREIYDHAFSTDRRRSPSFDAWQIRRYCPTTAEDDLAAFARELLLAAVEDGVG